MLEGIQRCMSRERRVAIEVLLEIGLTMHDFESELPTRSRQSYVQVASTHAGHVQALYVLIHGWNF